MPKKGLNEVCSQRSIEQIRDIKNFFKFMLFQSEAILLTWTFKDVLDNVGKDINWSLFAGRRG